VWGVSTLHLVRRLALLAALAALLAPVAATAGTPGKAVLATAGRVITLAADATRVAVATRGRGTCDRIVVWRPLAGTSSSFAVDTNCPGAETSGGQFLAELALAGQRVAWVEAFQGNLQDLVLRTRLLGKPIHEVAFAENGSGAAGSPEGDYVGKLFGDDSLIAYNTWSICIAYPAGFEVDPPPGPPCDEIVPPGESPVEIVYDARLHRIGSAAPIATGSASFPAVAVQAGRVGVLEDESVEVIRASDGLTQTFPVALGAVDAAFFGETIVVLRGNSLEVLGGPTYPFPNPGGATPELTDLHGSTAVVVAGRKLHLVDLDSGELKTISVPGVGAIDAELEAAGLVYSYSVTGKPKRGRVVFRSAASLGGPAGYRPLILPDRRT
jgi:hypothetical protein